MKGDLSIPSSRDLPPGRLAQRRGHLISEIAQPPSRFPLPRRGSLALVAVALIVVLVGTASAIGGVRDFFFTPGVNSKIAYIQNPRSGSRGDKELWVMNADGSEPKRLSRIACCGPLAWAPDETKIAFVRGLRAIYVVSADGSSERRLVRAAGHANARHPVWSPDGRKIAFVKNRPGRYADIYVMSADGSGLRNLTQTPEIEGSPAWSPDGRKIAFWRLGDHATTGEVYVMNADGSGQRSLSRNTSSVFASYWSALSWSPDGRKIAFSAQVEHLGLERVEVFVMNADGSGLRNLARGVFPAWSPDGRRIAFLYGRTPSAIYVMNADGSRRRKLGARPNPDSAPAWSPDGRKIAFVARTDSQIWVVNADGSGLRRLTRTPRANWEPSWSPGQD